MIIFWIYKFICWAYEIRPQNDIIVGFFGLLTFAEFILYICGIYSLVSYFYWRLQKKEQSK